MSTKGAGHQPNAYTVQEVVALVKALRRHGYGEIWIKIQRHEITDIDVKNHYSRRH